MDARPTAPSSNSAEIAPPNVTFIERFLPAEELPDLYRRATCYIQASAHEGFGIAVAEAMACGAVPVVTKRFSLPEVTGDLGLYIPFEDPKATAAAARRTLTATPQQRAALRTRVVQNYPQARRERELIGAIRPSRRIAGGWGPGMRPPRRSSSTWAAAASSAPASSA